MKLKLSLLLFCIYASLWAQTTQTFPSNGTIFVPAGITLMDVQAWGGGGAGGGASGSALTEGRGAAGGGGGAYARANITVVAGTTLNVVVAPQTTGTAGNGGTGGASTITGFESSIFAAGGSGGAANNAGGSPAGGPGGLNAGSIGTTKNPGSSGNNGSTVFLSVLFSSGKGGNAATPGGGAGGAAVGPVILGSGPGNIGAVPGGGGGGAMSSALSAAQLGGSGAPGQVTIIYTCPTYNISTTSALNACATSGTSTVTVTGPAVNLPVGTYIVTFNRSIPAGTALTATMTVSSAGTGTFPVTGLTTIGSSTITITKIESGTCFNTISSNNTANITVSGATVGGTVGNGSTICSGFTSANLTLTGQTGDVIKWQSSTDGFSTFTDIPNTTLAYTSGPLNTTTQFRAVVQNGACSVVNSNPATVTVNPLPSIVIGTVPAVCNNATSTVLNYSSPTGSPTTYSIVWSSTPTNSFAAVTNVSLPASPITIPIPAATPPGTYTGTLTVKNLNGCVTSPGLSFSVIILPLPAAPTIGTIVVPTCAIPTGSIPLTGLPAGGTLIMYPGAIVQPYSGTTANITGLSANTYSFTVSNATCTSLISANAVVPGLETNIYTTSWSAGTPNLNQNLVFAGNFTSAGGGAGNINGCSCTINSGINITMLGGDTMTLRNALTNSGGVLTFENNASLLQTGNAVNTGNIFYKRNTSPVRRLDFTYWSSPVTRTPIFTLNNLSPNTFSGYYYKYNPNSGWITIINGAEEMAKGIGYIVAAPESFSVSSPSVYSAVFEGVPNNGTIPITLIAAEKWNLIGNPYPSAVYADQFIFDNTANLYGTLYFWTHNSSPANTDPGQVNRYFYTSNDYAAYNLTGSVGSGSGTGAPTPGNQSPPLGYIAAGQAFFVKSKTTNSASFTNLMRVPANNAQFFRTIETNESQIEKHRIWLNFTNTQGAFKQTLVGYITGATNTWDDNYDGLNFNGNEYVDFYSINEEKKLTIQGRALPFTNTDQVLLGYKSTIAGEFSISIDRIEGLFSDQSVYLEDKLTGKIHNLKESNYTFITEIGTFTDRFVLRYTNTTLGTDDFKSIENGILVSVKNKIINIISSKQNINEISIYDISGKLLYSKKKIGNSEFQIQNLPSANQVLVVKTTLDNEQTVTNKIVF